MPEDCPLARETFKDQGTPVAYLLDQQGKVAQPVALGGDEILALTRGVVGNRAKRTRLPGERPSIPEPHRAERPQGGYRRPGVPLA